MNFINTWQDLDEIYQADFTANNTGEAFGSDEFVGPLYHFYEDLSDLLNSLKLGIIYSTKNDKNENPSQFDYSLDGGKGDGKAYICMTNTLAGKKYMTGKFRRPYGIAIKASSLNRLLETNTISAYSAFGAKGNYTASSDKQNKDGSYRKKSPSLVASGTGAANAFRIYSIGQLDDNLYFVCGGQGANRLWPGQTFSDEKLYKTLKSWFQRNWREGGEYQKRMYYHFKDGKVLSPAQERQEKPIKAYHNLNKLYKPRADKKLDDNNQVAYNSTICFKFKGPYKDTFKEVFGYGPVNATDENGRELLTLEYVNPNAVGGYSGPLIFGMNVDDQTYAKKTTYFKARGKDTSTLDDENKIDSSQTYMMADEKLFKKLMNIFNENEYRIYLNNALDFKFTLDDIDSVVLPEVIRLASYGETINIRKIAHCIEHNIPIDYKNPQALTQNFIVIADSFLKKVDLADIDTFQGKLPKGSDYLSNYSMVLVKNLYEILSNPSFAGDKVSYELLPNTAGKLANFIKAKATLGTFLRTGETSNEVVVKDGEAQSSDRSRKVLSKHMLPKDGKLVDGQNDEKTVLGPVVIPGVTDKDGEAPLARLGSEVILVARDQNGNKYVLFVYKSKSSDFMELPGGGFDTLPSEYSSPDKAYEDLLKDKLLFKCNVRSDQISDLIDTEEALILHEKGVAKTKEVHWDWSYYRLFTAKYKPVLTEEDLAALGYTYDNSAEAQRRTDSFGKDAKGNYIKKVHGYRAHMRWVPIEDIELNRSITDRYSNVIHIIRAVAKSM
jgi:hypothetical protein